MASVLITLGVGLTDFGRVFSTNEDIYNAAREAARQATLYDNVNQNYPNNTDAQILALAQQELGSSMGANLQLGATPDLTGTCPVLPNGSTPYPGSADSGFLYVCRTAAASSPDGRNHVEVIITWRASLITPLVSSITGVPQLHSVVDATFPVVVP